jgi:hypothetical protein
VVFTKVPGLHHYFNVAFLAEAHLERAHNDVVSLKESQIAINMQPLRSTCVVAFLNLVSSDFAGQVGESDGRSLS